MIKATLIVTLGVLALAFAVDRQASAAPSTETELALEGGCPRGGGWTLAPEFFVLESIDRGDWTDYNGDHYLCFRIPPGFCANRGVGHAAPSCAAWIWKDNDNPGA